MSQNALRKWREKASDLKSRKTRKIGKVDYYYLEHLSQRTDFTQFFSRSVDDKLASGFVSQSWGNRECVNVNHIKAVR